MKQTMSRAEAASNFRIESAGKRKSSSSERIAVQIGRFLADQVPHLFCDDCITDQLNLTSRRQANRVTAVFGKKDSFWRDVAACSLCLRHKVVIRHA